MAEFEFDNLDKLYALMKISPEAAGKGVTRAMGDIKDDWVRESRDIAPLDTSNLRRQIHGDVKPGIDGYVEIEANATSDTGGNRFNYAYYIHEYDAGGRRLRTPGTVKKFLDVSAEKRKEDYKRWIIEEIQAELKKAGW